MPHNVKKTKDMDDENGDMMWKYATDKEEDTLM